MLSAIVGMAGGIILLSTMLIFLEPSIVIPIHGAIQLVSNTSRATVQRRHLAWSLIWRYGLLLFPMGLLAIGLVTQAPENLLKGLIGVFVLFATWRPRWLLLGSNPQSIDSKKRFILLGGVVGFLNIIVGAVGPFIAPVLSQRWPLSTDDCRYESSMPGAWSRGQDHSLCRCRLRVLNLRASTRSHDPTGHSWHLGWKPSSRQNWREVIRLALQDGSDPHSLLASHCCDLVTRASDRVTILRVVATRESVAAVPAKDKVRVGAGPACSLPHARTRVA